MKVAVVRSGKIVSASLDDPIPGPGQVLVRTHHCGICGSDLHALKHGDMSAQGAGRRAPSVLGSADWGRDLVMGHEFCAEIVDYGPQTQKTLPIGQLVCSIPLVFHQDKVHSIGYSNDAPGGYGEYMLLSEALLLPVPSGLSSEQAALTEPMAVGAHAVAKAALEREDVCLVLGCGSVGLAVITALKVGGHGPIVAADFSPTRRRLAEALGADTVVDPAVASPYDAWEALATPEGYEAGSLASFMGLGPKLRPTTIFECVGIPGIIEQVMRESLPETKIIVVGVCMEKDSFQPLHGILSQLNLRFVLGYTPEEFAATLGLIDDGKIDVRSLVTKTVGLDGVAGAFAELAQPDKHAKILVAP